MGHSMDYLLYVMDTRALEDDAEFERWLEMVSEYRRRKVLRLRRREDRNASLAAGCLLSYALKQYAGIDERNIVYIKNKSGKPFIIEMLPVWTECVRLRTEMIILIYNFP